MSDPGIEPSLASIEIALWRKMQTVIDEFMLLRRDIFSYSRVAAGWEFFSTIGEGIEDAVTGQHGDMDWFDAVHSFFDEVTGFWRWEADAIPTEDRNQLPTDDFLASLTPEAVGKLGVHGVKLALRKMTAAAPEIEEFNWTSPGDVDKKPDPERDRRFNTAFKRGLVVAALRRLNELLEFSPEAAEVVLRLKPVFASLTAEQFRTWNGFEPKDLLEGGTALYVPYPEYHPVVTDWTSAVYCTPFSIDPYREVRGEEEGVPPPRFMGIGERGRPTPEEFFATADIDEVRQYMAVCIRGEHWCDGYIGREFERGVIQAAFARLEALQRSTYGD